MGGYTQLLKATNGVNKYSMNFYDAARKRVNTIHFGKSAEESYITSQDLQLKLNYIAGHASREDWGNPMCEKTLERYLLFNKPTLSASYTFYRNLFNYDLY
jgi:hypothetical protein